MIPKHDWRWYGSAGHFICADRCLFHMTTQIGQHLVSTVGECSLPMDLQSSSSNVACADADKEVEKTIAQDFLEIGLGRLYETMVFRITKYCECDCGLPMHDGDELDMAAYNTAKDANEGHLRMCEKWSKK